MSDARRPLAVGIISGVFIVAGTVGLVYHLTEFRLSGEAVWVLALRVLAIVGGFYLLQGKNWARWVLVGWLGYHVVLSFAHSLTEVVVHGVLMVVVAFFLFRPPASTYFK